MAPPVTSEALARVDAYLQREHGRLGDLASSGRDFARAINRLQRIVRMVLVSEDKTFRRTVQRWRLVDAPQEDGRREILLGTERRGAGEFALIACWAPESETGPTKVVRE